MIRGVNRHIIEVSDTKNEYFERAILFVRPEFISENESTLRRQADTTVAALNLGTARLSAPGCERVKRKSRKNAVFVMAACAAAGALFCAGVMALILRIF